MYDDSVVSAMLFIARHLQEEGGLLLVAGLSRDWLHESRETGA
jgi:hypothetical protein